MTHDPHSNITLPIDSPVPFSLREDGEGRQWQPIETAPADTDFLAYGSYLYPGDKNLTEYFEVAALSGDPEWPVEDMEGKHPPGFYTHWMPLPPAPTSPVDIHKEG